MKEADTRTSPGSYYFVNLGCPKNLADAERVAAGLEAAGWRMAPSIHEAELIVVTTCAFISMAEEESVELILEIAAAKSPTQRLAVLGCLVSREGARLESLLPEVDYFLDVGGMTELPARLAAVGAAPIPPDGSRARGRVPFTPPHIAYLKIAEGCSNHCTYCTIPSIRGELRSRGSAEIEAEVSLLASAGVREIVVVAQDTTAWDGGPGGGSPTGLGGLLERVAAVGPPWVRLMYLHPARTDPGSVIDLAARGVILPYLDIPVQHASDRLLDRMGRGYGRDRLRRIFESLRSSHVDFVLRTTVMVGFPGETESDFDLLSDFLEEFRFDHVGVFEFSPERGTGAERLDGRVPDRVKVERRDALIELQMDISHERLETRVGGRETIIVDGLLDDEESPGPGIWGVGRFYGQSYEIDGVVYLSGTSVAPGRFASGRITDAGAYDLFAAVDRDLG